MGSGVMSTSPRGQLRRHVQHPLTVSEQPLRGRPAVMWPMIITAIFLPLVMLYQGWTYWVFRKRVTVGPVTTS